MHDTKDRKWKAIDVKNLVIVESPTKAKTLLRMELKGIAKNFGSGIWEV